jgi:hypothetical protein
VTFNDLAHLQPDIPRIVGKPRATFVSRIQVLGATEPVSSCMIPDADWRTNRLKTPILVTGSHRSGTTWTARMLHLSGDTGYIVEPFKPTRYPGWLSVRPEYWFQNIDEANEGRFIRPVQDLLRFRYSAIRAFRSARNREERSRAVREWRQSLAYRARDLRPLVKDPIAVFAAEWLSSRFDFAVVFLVRHPAAFASSILRLNWSFNFKQWTRQPSLMERYLTPFAEEIVRASERPPPLIDQATLLWKSIYSYAAEMRRNHPEWIFARHEDLAVAPLAEFHRLFSTLDLPWSVGTNARIADFNSPRNKTDVPSFQPGNIRRNSVAATQTWLRRLDKEQIRRVRRGTESVWPRFYSSRDWIPSPGHPAEKAAGADAWSV